LTKSSTDGQQPTLPTHGATRLPSVIVDNYNLELEDETGFIGDQVNRAAFGEFLDQVRDTLRDSGVDPLGDKKTAKMKTAKVDALLAQGNADAGAVVHSAVEAFAQQLATVIKQFLRQKTWRDTECIFGGGFRASRVGELAICACRNPPQARRHGRRLRARSESSGPGQSYRRGPSAAALNSGELRCHSRRRLGGTNIRSGVVVLKLAKAKDLSKAEVSDFDLWRHQDAGVSDGAVQHLITMLTALISRAKKRNLWLAPVIGIGCPRVIRRTGRLSAARRTCPATGRATLSTCRTPSDRRSPG
jgi:hypothetical protein